MIIIIATFAQALSGNALPSTSLVSWSYGASFTLLAAALVGFIVTAAYKSAILAEPDVQNLHSVNFMWRLLIGLGAVPGVIALYFRLTIPETPRFTMDIERNIDQAATDIQAVVPGRKNNIDDDAFVQRIEVPKASWADFREHFGKLENFKILFGTAYSWFALGWGRKPIQLMGFTVLTILFIILGESRRSCNIIFSLNLFLTGFGYDKLTARRSWVDRV
ncbi:hypothetical protein BJ912DRAFT_1023881 [Pholiota molesta]|nr:hypothetical protein BJ912DRAFT_1023881 [Pholiota molesta]